MNYFHFLFLLFLSTNIQAQEGTVFLDMRDNNSYQTIEIAGKIWFQGNIRFETDGCYCKGRKKRKKLCKITNYYPYTELHKVCPAGWHVATLSDWEEVIELVKKDHQMDLNLIQYDTIENGTIMINSYEFKLMEDQTILKFKKIGWVEGRKILKKRNTTLWINNERIDDDRYHVHFGDTGYVKHTHKHDIDDIKKRRRRFAVRCVMD